MKCLSIFFLLLQVLLASVVVAQQRALVDRSGRVLATFPDSVDTPNLNDPIYGRLQVKRKIPPKDWKDFRVDTNDKPVPLLVLTHADTVVVNRPSVNVVFNFRNAKGRADPDTVSYSWSINPVDSLAIATWSVSKPERGFTKSYGSIVIRVNHPRDPLLPGVGILMLRGAFEDADVILEVRK